MAVPKRKTSKSRRDKRRASNFKMKAPGLIACPNCGELIPSHIVCPFCGHYKGKEVIEVEE